MSVPTSPSPASAAQRPRVAFQGERGAYSEDAIAAHWRGRAEPVPARDSAAVVRAVKLGAVDYGLLPIENTIAGSVGTTYDALEEAEGLSIVGEVVTPIHHCLLAPRGASIERLEVVESHPIALAQCRAFFEAHPALEARAAYDTAGAAREVAARGDPRFGAIAGRAAAERFGLAVLAPDIEDRPDNQTRFLVLATHSSASGRGGSSAALPAGTPARTAIIAVAANVPGSLVRLLQPLSDAGFNMSKLESRPTGSPWTYQFFVEFEHAANDASLAPTLDAMRSAASSLTVLGTFARDMGAAAPAPEAVDVVA